MVRGRGPFRGRRTTEDGLNGALRSSYGATGALQGDNRASRASEVFETAGELRDMLLFVYMTSRGANVY